MKGHKFSDDEVVICTTNDWLEDQEQQATNFLNASCNATVTLELENGSRLSLGITMNR